MNNFPPSNFFDLTNFKYKEIFEGVENVWEVLPKIGTFIEELFKQGKIVGNYSQKVYVEEGAEVDKTARIIGPAIICKGVKVGFNAYLRENVIIGENTQVRFACEIKNSIVLNNTILSHMNYLGDSILGNNVNMGAGAKTANLRFDNKNVVIKVSEEQKIDTNLWKFGAVLGDGTKVGVNSVLNPGTLIGKNSLIYPLMLVKGIHQDNSVIK